MSEIAAVGYTDNLPIDNPEALVDVLVSRPILEPHDLLVEVRAVSVNPVDVKERASTPPDGTRILGFDAAGIVVEVGTDVTLFETGDHVFYAGDIDRSGSNTAFQAVDERIVGRKPASLSFADAAALPLTALAAWEALFDKLRLSASSRGTLLVVGGAGGVGSIMIQIVKAIAPDVRVIATASRTETRDWVLGFGADDVADHSKDLAAEVLALEPEGVDWIFTSSSSRPGALEAYVAISKPFGQIVAIDDPESLDVVALKSKSLTWHWEFMFARSLHQAPDLIRQHQILDSLAELVDGGRIRTTATTRLCPINAEQVREAHRLVETGKTIGKVVVTNE